MVQAKCYSGPWQWGCRKCLLDWLTVTPGLGFHHAVLPAAVCSSSNKQPGGDADHGGGGQHWGDGVRARDVIYLPLTAYRLFIKWAGSYGSDCRGMWFIPSCTVRCAYKCINVVNQHVLKNLRLQSSRMELLVFITSLRHTKLPAQCMDNVRMKQQDRFKINPHFNPLGQNLDWSTSAHLHVGTLVKQ